MDDSLAARARKGRGAVSNASGRFEPERRAAIDDGWGSADAMPAPLDTIYARDTAKTVITRNDSPDIPFERSINPSAAKRSASSRCALDAWARKRDARRDRSPRERNAVDPVTPSG